MKINKEKLRELEAMGDDELWREIRTVAASYGFTLPEATPKKCDMDKLRGTVKGADKINLGEAARIINDLRRGKNNG